MDIYAKEGHRVVFHNRGGYPSERLRAAEILKTGLTYAVDHTDVHQSSTTVYLQEFPGQGFNSVLFDDAEPVQKLDDGNSDQPQRIPFNLERALAGDPVVRRDGVKVSEVLRFRGGNVLKPVVSLAENGGFFLHNEDGKMFGDEPDMRDLFMAPKTKTVWVNLYGDNHNVISGETTYFTEETARDCSLPFVDNRRTKECVPYLTTVSVEVPA